MNLKWRTRKKGTPNQVGKRFPIERPDKASLPRGDMIVVSEPDEGVGDKIKEEVKKFTDKVHGIQDEAQAERVFTEDEIIEAGLKELEEELDVEREDIKLTDGDEITVKTITTKLKGTPKAKDEDIDWAEHLRREAAFKKSKGLSSVS